MATRWAVATGNWSNTATWNGGTLPAAGDDVHTNTFTVTIDQNINVGSLRSTAGSGITAGGGFTVTAARNITLTGAQGTFPGSTTTLILFSHATGTSTLTSNIMAGSGANFIAVAMTAAGNINFTGSVGHITGLGATTISLGAGANGTYNITGDVTGAASASAPGLLIASSATIVNVTGNVIAGASGSGITSAGILTVNGSITASVLPGITITNGSLSHSGGAITASATSAGVQSTSSTTATVTSTGPFISSTNRMAVASIGSFKIAQSTTTTYWTFPTGDASTRTLYTADNVGGNPAIANVRQGTVYGPANELTGTLKVPNPVDVRQGVQTDNTVGTAPNLDAEAFWEYLLTDDLPNGSAGQKLKRLMVAVMG